MGKKALNDKRNWLHNSIEVYRTSRQSIEDRLRVARSDCENTALAMRTAEEAWRSVKLKRDELISSLAYIDGTIADLDAEMKAIENYLTQIGIEESAERKEIP